LKAICELTLAYVKIISRLSNFKKKEVSNEVCELVLNAYKKLEDIWVTSQFIVLTVGLIAGYLIGKVNFNELLKELDKIIKKLEEEEGSGIRSWAIKQFIDVIKRKEDIDEDTLRLEGIKLLLVI
jgi:hypothetical protein